MSQHQPVPWWVRIVTPLRSNCFACNIWRGIIVGACGMLVLVSTLVSVLLLFKA